MRRRRHREPEASSHERWLVSYADLITLLFAFFTVLYAISTVDKSKAQHAAASMAAALRVKSTVAGAVPQPKPAVVAEPPANPLLPISQELGGLASSPALSGRMQVSLTKRGVVVSLSEAGFFEVGKADVLPEALGLLDQLAQSLKAHDQSEPLSLTVEGHTDDKPLHGGAKYKSNWELSTARATAVLQLLADKYGFKPAQLAAAGYGEFRPRAPNDTPEGRAKNRRVDILVRLADGDAQ